MYKYRRLTPEEQRELVRERILRGMPRHRPPHYKVDDALYFITAACYEHKHVIHSPARRDALLERIREKLKEAEVKVHAWVILSNHYHLLVHTPDFATLERTIGLIHGGSSFEWNAEEGRRGRRVWYRFGDRKIRSLAHYYTTLTYIHYNPVKHRYTQTPYDWAWSSVHWYRKRFGRQWLRDIYRRYPLRDYGKKWDNFDLEE